jgi:hypothetical protein
MATNIRVRESTENIPSGRRVRDVSNEIHYLDPNENPFTLLMKRAGKRTVVNSKFEWLEKSLPDKVDQIDTTTGTGATLQVDNANRWFINDLGLVVRTGELFRVTAVSSPNLSVVRGVGSVSAVAVADNDDLIIVANANPEGGTLGTERSIQETIPYNYTQIFRQPFGTTGTEEVSENYGGKDKTRLRKENAVYHMIDLERNFIYGQRNINTSSTAQPIRFTGGALYWITTNVQDAGGTLTEPEFETFMQTVFTATGSSSTRVLLAAPGVLSVIDQLAAGRLQMTPRDKTYGIDVQQWITSHGTLNIVKHRLLVNGPGGTGYAGYAIAVDPGKLKYCPLRERDTKLRMDVGTPGDDGWTDEYLTEAGFEFENESAMGVLKSVTS